MPDVDVRRPAAPSSPARRESRARAEDELRRRLPRARVDWEPRMGSPAWVMVDGGFLTGPDGAGGAVSRAFRARQADDDPQRAAKAFADAHSGLFGHDASTLSRARVKRDYVTAHSGMRTTVWQQEHAGLDIFEAVFQAHTTRRGELVNVASRFLPEFDDAVRKAGPKPPVPAIDAAQAVAAACRDVGEAARVAAQLTPQSVTASAERRHVFSGAAVKGEACARLLWLPLDGATLQLAWEVTFTPRIRQAMFLTLIDAETGRILLRRCLTDDISNASYRVYTGDSPTPFSPGYASPGQTNQPATVARTLVTWTAMDTNASPAGWINDGVNETLGNNVDAHTDLDEDDVADLPRPAGSPSRVFDFTLNLAQGPSAYAKAAVANLFYWCNWTHDRLYQLGFTEAAGNFQQNNFGRGGTGGDPVLADAQDGGGTNNANFATPADGASPRMQMYVFSGTSPLRDGDLDAQVIIHEYVHGLANRLVGGGVLISATQTKGQGEGWSDFYALALLSSAGESPTGTYAMGAYAVAGLLPGADNYYFGIRRYPYSTDMSKNPQTFKDIDPAKFSDHPGVPVSKALCSNSPSEVHNVGEIWCAILWEVRAALIAKHGFATGNELALQLVTDGMKLSPANPTFTQSRDAILQADMVLGGANQSELWTAFAKRGLGVGALAPASGTTTGVQEDYNLPDTLLITPISWIQISGLYGGPFNWTNASYTLSNSTLASIGWTATAQPPLQLSASSGTLTAHATATNVVSLNAVAAAALPVGEHLRTAEFSNNVTHVVSTRSFTIHVTEPLVLKPSNPFSDYDLLYGPEGGPFQSDDPPLVLTNTAAVPVQWEVVAQPVATYAPLSGTLGAHQAANLTPVAGVGAPFFSPGNYTNTVIVSDTTSSGFLARDVRMFVRDDDFLTQGFGDAFYFSEPFDLANTQLTFFPDGSSAGYAACREAALSFPVNPASGTPILGSGGYFYDSEPVTLSGGKQVSLFGVATNTVTVNLNGSITFGAGDGTYHPDHFAKRRVSGVLGSSNSDSDSKDAGGAIVWQQTTNALVVTWQNIVNDKAYAAPSTNSFQVEMFFDGRIRITILKGTEQDAVVGLSSGAGYPPNFISTDFSKLPSCDNVFPPLVVVVPSSAKEGVALPAGAGHVYAVPAPPNNLTVTLSSSDTSEITVPPSVIIPAGSTGVSFNVTVVNDAILDGSHTALVKAEAPLRNPGWDAIVVDDNETTTLTLSLPASVTEGGAPGTGTVTTAATVGDNLAVFLSSPTQPSETALAGAGLAILHAGQNSAKFTFSAIDDSRIDGVRTSIVVASVANWVAATGTVLALDNESTNLTVVGPAFIGEGDAVYFPSGAEVRISGTLPSNLTVNVSTVGGSPSEYVAYGPVTIPVGQTNAAIDLSVLDDSEIEPLETFKIVASAPGFGSGQWSVLVFDNDGPPPALDPHPAHLAEGVSVTTDLAWSRTEGELLVNGGFEDATLTGWTRADSGGGGWASVYSSYDPPGTDTAQPALSGRYALSYQYGNGRHELYQDVLIPEGISNATLRWSHRLRNHGGAWASDQQFRVELRDLANTVMTNLFVTQPGQPLLGEWTNGVYNLWAWRGQALRVAFVEVDERGSLNVSLDNVSVYAAPTAPTTWQVYFGTDPSPDATEFRGTTTNTSWTLATLVTNTVYYWQVRSIRNAYTNNNPIWQFTTSDSSNQPPVVSLRHPGNNASFTYPATINFDLNTLTDDGTVSKVEFWADSAKIGEDSSSPYGLSWTNAMLGEHVVWAVAQDSLGARGTSIAQHISVVPAAGILKVLVPFGADWTYLDTGTDLGTAWRATSYRSAARWKTGAAQLGYGDGDEATVVDYGDDPYAKYVTTYFRKSFVAPSGLLGLQLRVLRDDGVAVYLNGNEVLRDGLPAGAGFRTYAAPNIPTAQEAVPVVASLSATNAAARRDNVLAAEVHQSAANSPDLSFDLELSGVLNPLPSVTLVSPAPYALFVAPANVPLAASASEAYGVVSNVQFTVGGNALGSVSAAPFAMTWSNAPVGTHLLRAVAADGAGATNVSALVTVYVVGPPPLLTLAPGPSNVVLSWPAASGGYRAETATNLLSPVQWEPVPGAPATQSNLLELVAPPDAAPRRFFRLVAP